jgi:hypothetical protein
VEAEVRTWRVGIAFVFPKREPEMVDERGNPGFPKQLLFESRVAEQATRLGDMRVGLRAWPHGELPAEITGPLNFQFEVAELVVIAEAETDRAALEVASPIVDEVIEDLSFKSQFAVRPLMTSIHDVTTPVSVGDVRAFSQLAGYPLPAFLQSVALGHVAIAPEAQLPASVPERENHVLAARGWYAKSLSTPFVADQFIFLWIALESLWAKSEHKTSGPFRCPHGDIVEACPSCDTPLEKPVFGLGVQAFLVKEAGLTEDDAKKLWRARQIMHGAVPFDSTEMRDLPAKVQVLRAAVVAALKPRLGLARDAWPLVVPGVLAIDPSGTGVSGEAPITADELGWP